MTIHDILTAAELKALCFPHEYAFWVELSKFELKCLSDLAWKRHDAVQQQIARSYYYWSDKRTSECSSVHKPTFTLENKTRKRR